MPLSFIKPGMILLPTVAAVASLASKMIATVLMLKVFLKYGTVVRPSTPSSMVLRNAQGRLSLATPGFDEACEVETTFISLATGNVTSRGAAGQRARNREHLIVAGELAQIVGRLRRLGRVVEDHNAAAWRR